MGRYHLQRRWSDYLINGEGLPVDKWVHTPDTKACRPTMQ
jgi:hypothetical protein